MLNEKDIEDCTNWEDAKAKLESDSRFSDAPSEGRFLNFKSSLSRTDNFDLIKFRS